MMTTIPTQTTRLLFLVTYLGLLVAINKIAFDQFLPPQNHTGLWFYTGFVSVILGNLIVTPYFVSPGSALSYATPSLMALYATQPPVTHFWGYALWVILTFICASISYDRVAVPGGHLSFE